MTGVQQKKSALPLVKERASVKSQLLLDDVLAKSNLQSHRKPYAVARAIQ
jgi:hypothetical protein